MSWWYYNGIFGASVLEIKQITSNNTVPNLICTRYKTNSYNAVYTGAIGISLEANTSGIRIKDTSYYDAIAFQNAIKGILLAYEKA